MQIDKNKIKKYILSDKRTTDYFVKDELFYFPNKFSEPRFGVALDSLEALWGATVYRASYAHLNDLHLFIPPTPNTMIFQLGYNNGQIFKLAFVKNADDYEQKKNKFLTDMDKIYTKEQLSKKFVFFGINPEQFFKSENNFSQYLTKAANLESTHITKYGEQKKHLLDNFGILIEEHDGRFPNRKNLPDDIEIQGKHLSRYCYSQPVFFKMTNTMAKSAGVKALCQGEGTSEPLSFKQSIADAANMHINPIPTYADTSNSRDLDVTRIEGEFKDYLNTFLNSFCDTMLAKLAVPTNLKKETINPLDIEPENVKLSRQDNDIASKQSDTGAEKTLFAWDYEHIAYQYKQDNQDCFCLFSKSPAIANGQHSTMYWALLYSILKDTDNAFNKMDHLYDISKKDIKKYLGCNSAEDYKNKIIKELLNKLKDNKYEPILNFLDEATRTKKEKENFLNELVSEFANEFKYYVSLSIEIDLEHAKVKSHHKNKTKTQSKEDNYTHVLRDELKLFVNFYNEKVNSIIKINDLSCFMQMPKDGTSSPTLRRGEKVGQLVSDVFPYINLFLNKYKTVSNPETFNDNYHLYFKELRNNFVKFSPKPKAVANCLDYWIGGDIVEKKDQGRIKEFSKFKEFVENQKFFLKQENIEKIASVMLLKKQIDDSWEEGMKDKMRIPGKNNSSDRTFIDSQAYYTSLVFYSYIQKFGKDLSYDWVSDKGTQFIDEINALILNYLKNSPDSILGLEDMRDEIPSRVYNKDLLKTLCESLFINEEEIGLKNSPK